MSSQLIFFSHRLELLVKELYTQIELDRISIFDRPLIVIPHPTLKEWIQIECAKISKNKGLLGWEFMSWEQALPVLAGSLKVPSLDELRAAIWNYSLKRSPKEWEPFLVSEKKRLDLTETCASLFFDYLVYGFPSQKVESWQKSVFNDLLKDHSWLTFPEALKGALFKRSSPVYLFGQDYLPPALFEFYFSYPALRAFQFSPTAMYWEDVRSSKERRALLKREKKKGISQLQLDRFDELLRAQQPLLANWGSIGRKMSSLLANQEIESVDIYELDGDPESMLSKIQLDLLTMDQCEKTVDDTFQVIQTGQTLFREVEILKDEIIRLAEIGISFSEMRVYAPDISSYAPLIEFVFANEIPFRISGVDLAKQSSFFQGIDLLCKGVSSRWGAKEWVCLLETKSFCSKQGWGQKEVEQIKGWLDLAHIRWGVDRLHRDQVTQESVESKARGRGSWEEGFDRLLDHWVYFDGGREDALQWSDSDLFEQFLITFRKIRTVLCSWREEKTLVEWAQELEKLAEEFLTVGENSEEDRAAKVSFVNSLKSLRDAHECVQETRFPFSYVRQRLFVPSHAELGAHQLHAVRFASLEPGALLPARALFLLGMSEESFPRVGSHSSLHLLKNSSLFIPTSSDTDRYLFLQALFAAKERVTCFYGHVSREDGKSIGPSLLIQELLAYLKFKDVVHTAPSSPLSPGSFAQEARLKNRSVLDFKAAVASRNQPSSLIHSPLAPKVRGEIPRKVSLKELKRWISHPFRYYLEEIVGLEKKVEVESKWAEFEGSPLVRHLFLKGSLQESPEELLKKLENRDELPIGLIGLEIARDLCQRAADFRGRLENWGINFDSILTVVCKESCTSSVLLERGIEERPPLILNVLDSSVALIGEGAPTTKKGALHLGDDSIGGIIKSWPDLLFNCVMMGTEIVYCLKTGNERKIDRPLLALQSLVELFIQTKESPLFLHPHWADAILRKETDIDRETDDLVLGWILERSPLLDLNQEQIRWAPLLKEAFVSLRNLYPTRKVGALHADV